MRRRWCLRGGRKGGRNGRIEELRHRGRMEENRKEQRVEKEAEMLTQKGKRKRELVCDKGWGV